MPEECGYLRARMKLPGASESYLSLSEEQISELRNSISKKTTLGSDSWSKTVAPIATSFRDIDENVLFNTGFLQDMILNASGFLYTL